MLNSNKVFRNALLNTVLVGARRNTKIFFINMHSIGSIMVLPLTIGVSLITLNKCLCLGCTRWVFFARQFTWWFWIVVNLRKFYDYFKHLVPYIGEVVQSFAKRGVPSVQNWKPTARPSNIHNGNLKLVIRLFHMGVHLGMMFFNTNWHYSFKIFQL